ncbi:MAG: 4-hydroxy-tetrahydrodipicolinate reductase [Gemmatimonadales bacterium]
MSRLRLAIIGAGRMGQAVAGLAPSLDFDFAVVESADVRRGGVTKELLKGADVAVEFTAADAAPSNIRGCARAGCPVVCGTTGWERERAAVEADVKQLGGALLWAPNFAIGVHVFTKVVAEAGRRLRALPEFDAHIIDVHHSAKQDSPSGTAKLLQAQLGAALGRDVPVTSIRTGSVPGTHTVLFDAAFEQLRLEHVARDRRVFASGALMAARWLAGRRGAYTLDDMLGGGDSR